ncbi:MAG: tetratricopeptide repeat protein [Planctomycetaceae bacterium]|mgnify:CR=1 FL=1|jgi:thioredoxin-like negative regulator of GroEL|nr:tetratricopeptide repeat protein [Planctomycetaceae bacterium]MBT6156362.1 tetratricopeptide repeat protein [Planctomycetaceae bacterium]MBT6483866.1 tetratricopeptide repeat protein [Planctomycetaceae bacterium]MBT6497161.1 tetratricopeptide repeat protein [Planctomycetaceae bacterium]
MSRREQLEELLQSDPDDVFLQYALALEFVSAGDADEGLSRLAKVNDQHPEYVAAYFQRGQVLAEQGRTDEARDALTRGMKVAQQVGDAHAEREMSEFLETLG